VKYKGMLKHERIERQYPELDSDHLKYLGMMMINVIMI
jgi:hypothetical protein